MEMSADFLNTLKAYGVGRRKINDVLFLDDKPPPRLGIYNLDEEEVSHAIIQTQCTGPGCMFTTDSLRDFENHYNASHRYSCSECKKVLPSPHLLDLHIQEQHDSFFAVMATRKASYACYVEECKEKFLNAEERLNHCVKIHKLPKDFRFDFKPKHKSKPKKTQTKTVVDNSVTNKEQNFKFTNSKQKVFKGYTGKKFPEEKTPANTVNIDAIMTDLMESLPES